MQTLYENHFRVVSALYPRSLDFARDDIVFEIRCLRKHPFHFPKKPLVIFPPLRLIPGELSQLL